LDAEAFDLRPRRGRIRRRAGPSTSTEPPDPAPDLELSLPALPQQALLYRLCGDRDTLHSDPEFAAAAGFSRLKVSIWKQGDGFQTVVTAPERDDAVALGGVELVPA
jgi:acyl dehydratase